MFQQLDDPLPLPASSSAERQAVIKRGTALRRRRRALAVALPLGVAAAVTAVAVGSGLAFRPTPSSTFAPAASPMPTFDWSAPNTAGPAYTACDDPVGDSAGDPDLMLVSLDRPAYPFIHFHWDGSRLPAVGTVETLFEATSADGQRSRRLVVVLVDEVVEGQFVLDPATGVRQDVDEARLRALQAQHAADESAETAVGASFPGSAVMPLGDGWTWTASVTVDGTVVDTADGGDCW